MLRREQSRLHSMLRRHAGAGIYQYGSGIYQYGAGTTPYGGGIIPYGGCSMGATPLRRMGGAGIADFFKKGVKKIKSYFKKEGPSIAKAVASTAGEALTGLAKGQSVRQVGSQIADKAAAAAIKQVPASLQPIAEAGIKKARAKTGLGTSQYGGTSPLRPAKGELSAGQLKYLKQRSERKPNDQPPVFDRHELQMFGNIIQGKQIIGSGMRQ